MKTLTRKNSHLPEIMKAISALLLTLCLTGTALSGSIPVNAETPAYSYDASTATLTVYTDAGTTSWRNSVSASSVQHLVVAGSVNSITNNAFRDMAIIDANIQSGVMYIGNAAFKDCLSLTYVALPASMASVNETAFTGCSTLCSFTFGDSMAVPSWITHLIARGSETATRNYIFSVPTTAVGEFTASANDLMKNTKYTAIAVTPVTASPYYGAVTLIDYDADNSGYLEFVSSTLGKIEGAAQGATVVIETDKYHSFPDGILRQLNSRTDIILKVTWTENGIAKTFAIPSKYNALRKFSNGTGYVSFDQIYLKLKAKT